jgi:hypothetical protein
MSWITVNSYDGKSGTGKTMAEAQKNLEENRNR